MNAVTGEVDPCCRKCEAKALANLTPMQKLLKRAFVVCIKCGNKRCPKASDHDLDCTNSNAVGQKGSIYQ